jgi:anti-anti-sigma factor
MKMSVSQFGELGTKVVLVGKLDISGAEKIDASMAKVAESQGNIVVDMTGVDSIASIGIRHLVHRFRETHHMGRIHNFRRGF